MPTPPNTSGCFCRKAYFTNISNVYLAINYTRCSDLYTIQNLSIPPGATVTVWHVSGTFSTAANQSKYTFSPTPPPLGIFPANCGIPTPTPSPSLTPTVTPTVTPTISVSITITPSISVSKTPSVTPSVTPSISSTPTVSLSVTPSSTPSISISATPSVSITPTSTPSPSVSNTPSISVTSSISPSVTPSSGPTPSGFTVTIQEVGSNVVWSGSGSLDISNLSLEDTQLLGSGFNGDNAIWAVGPNSQSSVQLYGGVAFDTYPNSFGLGGTPSTNGTGDLFGVITGPSGRSLVVPENYVSGTQINGSTTYENATISGLNLVAGAYTYSWGSGAGEIITLIISVTPSVTPSITPSVTPSVSISNTPSISVSPSLSATPSISLSSTPSPTPSISISATPSISISATPSISISATPSISISATPSISISATPSISVSQTPGASSTPSISISATPSVTPSITVSPSTVIYQYNADLSNCCDAGYEFEGVKIQSTSELQSSDVVVVDVGLGDQCWTLGNVTPTSFVTPDFVITESYVSPADCSTCGVFHPCPSPTPSVTASVTPSVTPSISVSVTPSITATPSVTPTISITPSITPSTPPLLNEVTNCSTSITYLVNFSLIGYIPTGPVTYLNMGDGSTALSGCYTISQSEPPIGPSDGLVTDIGDNSTTCSQCTGKPIPSPSATPSISITPSPTISLTPSISISPTVSPSLTPSASQTVFTLTLTTESGADTCAKGELRIKKNGSVVAVWDKNQGFTTVVPSQSTVTFTSSDTMVLEGFSQGGGGVGCSAFTDTIVRGYYGASLEVIASTDGTNPDTFTIPNANATISAQFLAVS